MPKFVVPLVRTDRVFMQIVVTAKSELDAKWIVEVMNTDKLEDKSEFIGQEDGDYTVGDPCLVVVRKPKRRSR